jgi:urea transport system permease protein
MSTISNLVRRLVLCAALAMSSGVFALTLADALSMAAGENDDRVQAIQKAATSADPAAAKFLQSLLDGNVRFSADRVFVVNPNNVGDKALDAITGEAVKLPQGVEEPSNNNRMRREVGGALAALQLFSPDLNVRSAAIKSLASEADESRLALIEKAVASEADAGLKQQLVLIRAQIQLDSESVEARMAAAKALAASGSPDSKTLLLARLKKDGDKWVEPDAQVRAQLDISLRAIDGKLAWGERAGALFSGISLGSILLLAALGLAITYGLMGVINMAHGEMMMIGAYATYVVQNLFRSMLPDWFNAYMVAAVPASFIVAAVAGMALERTVIRWLYGRPLETLLATWGISLMLMQVVRMIFGAQNVQVENPSWMSGGIQFAANVVLPYNRIAIIAFAALVLAGMALLLSRTRLGLFVRGVTQNRRMAACVGVPTARVDTLAFGLGSGLAGLAGCALSQIGNVGPDLGQTYIVDSFMVVVLGGVGQLAGAVYAAMGLGVVNKVLEGMTGAVLAKIIVLVFIIIFIQKRPQGLFAMKGRSAEL